MAACVLNAQAQKNKGKQPFRVPMRAGAAVFFSMAKKRCLCYTCLSDFACGAEKEKLKKGRCGA
jgi:hypothetical protein